eukprot:g11869.t1
MRSAIRSWSLFVPPSVVERFYDAGLEAKVGVTRCEVTVLFCDIDGFEETCRQIDADEVLNNLTGVLGTIADEIQLQSGTFLEFISDEVMAVFNAPNKLKNHASAGLQCAVAIQKAVRKHKVIVNNEDCRPSRNIGSTQRIKYGLLGDGVNLAARMKGLMHEYGTCTLCSQNCLTVSAQQHPLPLATRPVDLVAVKGKTEPTKVCEVMGYLADDPSMAEAVKRHQKGFDLYLARGPRAWPKLQVYSCRVEEYMRNPPPNEWDGVEHLKSKSFAVAQRQKAALKENALGDVEAQKAKVAQEMANGMVTEEEVYLLADEDDPRPEEEVKGAGKPCSSGCTWDAMLCQGRQAANGEAPPAPIEVHSSSAMPDTREI